MAMGLLNPRSKNITRTGHTFAQVPEARTERSAFDRSSSNKGTFNAGFLIPIWTDIALPGSTCALEMTALTRLNTPLVPLMDNLYLDSFFFAVPFRLVWDNFKKFVGEQTNPGDSIAFTIPQMVSPVGGYLENTVGDYFGLPTKIAGFSHSCLWHRAMNLIYQEFFKDQNLINAPVLNKGDGPDLDTDYPLLRRGKRHDYFTSCLPSPQKGVPVTLPLQGAAFVKTNATAVIGGINPAMIVAQAASGAAPAANLALSAGAGGPFSISSTAAIAPHQGLYPTNLYADLSTATAATVNQLRTGIAIQQLLERDARAGTRYPEVIHGHWKVVHPDQSYRPVYLGGGSTPIVISPIPQTSNTPVTGTPQGNLAAIGTGVANRHGFTKSFTEWNLLIGFVNIRADQSYQNGLDRQWTDKTRYDFPWPELTHLGEVPVLNKEIFCQGTAGAGADDLVFGYQEKDAHYRYKKSIITGKMRSNATQPLDVWHLAQKYAALPVLGQTFIEENPPIDRVVAVPTQPHFTFDAHFKAHWAQPLPLYSVPGLKSL